MKLSHILSIIFNALIIGSAYATSYYIAASTAQDRLTIGAFVFGVLCYLLIRGRYKQDNATNKLMFKSYRLIVWSVPIVLFLINFHLYFSTLETKEFIEYQSFDDLLYFGIFAIAIWPLFLIVYLIGNTLIFIEKLLQTLHYPAIIFLSITLLIALCFAYRRLYVLKQREKINFNIPLATINALIPIALCTYCLVEVIPRFLK